MLISPNTLRLGRGNGNIAAIFEKNVKLANFNLLQNSLKIFSLRIELFVIYFDQTRWNTRMLFDSVVENTHFVQTQIQNMVETNTISNTMSNS